MSVSTLTIQHNYNYYIRNAYTKNRNAIKADYRGTQPNPTIMSADADAVRRMAEKLHALEYDSDHGTDVLQNTKAFIESYNNLLDSTDASDSGSIATLQKQLSRMTKNERDELASIGIEIKSNGKLSLDEKVFAESRPAKIGRILSAEGTFSGSVRSIAKKIYRTSNRLPVYTAQAQKTEQAAQNSGKIVDLSL